MLKIISFIEGNITKIGIINLYNALYAYLINKHFAKVLLISGCSQIILNWTLVLCCFFANRKQILNRSLNVN